MSQPLRGVNFGKILIALVVLGWAFQLGQYLWRISYWHDEAFIVLNVMQRSAGELAGRLDYEQAAPPGFLIMVRKLFERFGNHEYALRLVPLISTMLATAIVALVSRKLIGPIGAIWSTGIFVTAPELIIHAATVKQYASDVLVAAALLLPLSASRSVSELKRLAIASVLASVLVWFSHPTVFVYAGVFVALALRISRRQWPLGAALAVPVITSFVLLLRFSIAQQHSGFLDSYWLDRGAMMDWSRWWMLPRWILENTYELANHAVEPMGLVLLPAAVLGAYAWRARPDLIAATVGPIALTMLAGLAQQFPFGGSRVTLFLVPGLFLLAGRGIEFLRAEAPVRWRRFWLLLPFPVLACGLLTAVYHLFVPHVRSHIRPAVEYVRGHQQPGDAIYVVQNSKDKEFLCYWPDPPRPFANTFDSQAAPRTFWIVTGFSPDDGIEEIQAELEAARSVADERERFVGRGGAAIRFERK